MILTKKKTALSKRQDSLKKLKANWRRGTTLVELIVSLVLISILMAMAAAALSSASRIFVKVQKTQYAQSILDTVMTELRGMTEDASGYIKIYEKEGFAPDALGATEGSTLEFQTTEGYVEVLSQEGAEETAIYIGDKPSGSYEKVASGRLLSRYYSLKGSTGTYISEKDGTPVARAVAKVYGEGFYMKNYLEVDYKASPDSSGQVSSIEATLKLYATDSDGKKQEDPIATDTEVLELRNPLLLKTGEGSKTATADKESDTDTESGGEGE